MKVLALVAIAACSSKTAPPDHLLHTTQTADRTAIVGDQVDLGTLPFTEWIGLPAHGTANIKIDVATPGGDLTKANGTIDLACVGACGLTGATIHAGKGAFAGDLQIPNIDFDTVDAAVTIADGKATITRWTLAGKDVEIVASGKLTFDRHLEDSTIDACVRFRSMPGLRDRDPKLDALIQLTGAPIGADGMFNIRLADRLSRMRRIGMVCDGSAPPPLPPPAAPTLVDDGSAAFAASGSAAPLDDAARAKLIEAAVTPRADGADIDLKAMNQLLANPMGVGRGARLVPAFDHGKPIGFKLYAVAKTSLFARVGLQSGDMVSSVNGKSLASTDKALESFMSLRALKAGDTVELAIVRDGAPHTLVYHLK